MTHDIKTFIGKLDSRIESRKIQLPIPGNVVTKIKQLKNNQIPMIRIERLHINDKNQWAYVFSTCLDYKQNTIGKSNVDFC